MGSTINQAFMDYVVKFGPFQQRSMFGGIGLFSNGAMFALISNQMIFIRGGEKLDDVFVEKGCTRYQHVKKQTVATVNYYDITHLYESGQFSELEPLIHQSIENSQLERQAQHKKSNIRLRDLPNMQLTLERMVKKAGIPDVETFMSLSAEAIFQKVQSVYGDDVDIRLLWKFAGALDGVHWQLLQEPRKKELLAKVAA